MELPPPSGFLSAAAVHRPASRKKKEPFSPEEDAKLRDLVNFHGLHSWDAIVKDMPGRSARQCRERWNLYLSPTVKNDPWSLEEEQRLFNAYVSVGPRWSLIVQRFPTRTPNNIKNKVKQLIRRSQKLARPPALAESLFTNLGRDFQALLPDGSVSESVPDVATTTE
jgi:hypothetical protein